MLHLVFALTLGTARAAAPLTPRDLEAAGRLIAFDRGRGVAARHRTVVRVHREDGRRVRTRRAALLISGLYNSPLFMRAIEAHYVAHGYNVINLRLAGHHETDRSLLERSVRWEDWRRQSRDAIALARRLGDEVVLVGHSTGALLLTWLAVENTERVAALALFAPAFAVDGNSHALLRVAKRFGWTFDTAVLSRAAGRLGLPDRWTGGKRLVGHAGLEVGRMAKAFWEDVGRFDEPALEIVGERLRGVPVWMGLTEFDYVIDNSKANAVFDALGGAAPAARVREVWPSCERLLHDDLTTAFNPHLPEALRAIDALIRD